MVNFSKKLTKDQIPGWEEYYFNYRLLKARVKVYTEQTKEGNHDRRRVLKDFSKLLDDEIEKIVLFMIGQQGLIAARLEELGRRRTVLEDIPLVQEIAELKEDYRSVGLDLVRLLKFVDLNANAVRKILKKFDERLGYQFTDYYVRSRSNHPFSQLKQVFKHVGIGAVVGALSRNLGDLEEREGSYLNIYDQSPLAIPKDPIIDMIKATADKLTNSTNFLRFLGQHALIAEPDDAAGTEANTAAAEEKYHFISLVLNLANTFLYMVNTYIVVPTADDYATSLGAAATVCGIIIGSMPVAQVFSSVYFSAWSNRSYFRPLLFSSVVLLLGNVMYAMAYDFDSLTVLLVGRALCGMGSARAVNRRYISDCVPPRIRMQASAAFVSASALGMACGPAIAGLLQVNFKLYGITINQETLPGWVMAIGWFAYLIWLWISFEEPVLSDTYEEVHRQGSSAGSSTRHMRHLLKQDSHGDNDQEEHLLKQDAHGDKDQEEETPTPAGPPSVVEAYRLLTPSVKVQLLIYFMLKFSMEILLSESSVVTSYYFGWTTSTVAIFLATLGLTVLPVNAVVGTYISNMFEDRQILVASEVVLLAGVLLSFNVVTRYTAAQYVCSALLTFVAAEVLEGVNLSLLSQVMPARLSRGTWNGGLLSTEAGTLARVAADATITLAGYLGQGMLLNVTLLPSLLICVASIAATVSTYNSLFY